MSESKSHSWRPTLTSMRALGLAVAIVASACGGSREPMTTDTATVSPPIAEATPATQASTTTAPPASVTSTPSTSAAPALTKTVGLEYATHHTMSAGIELAMHRALDVYAPIESAGWPVVVVVHGLGGVRGEFARLAEVIATEGAVVFNISTVFSVPPIDGIDDISCAIRFARATAPGYGGDPTSITLVGYSSGAAKGSIVAMDGDAYGGDCAISDGSALPTAFVGYEGPFDYATQLYGTFYVPELKDEDPLMWEAVDPYSHIGGNRDLIVRLIHGRDEDRSTYDVRPEVSTEFHEALAAAGYDAEVIYLEGATHSSLRPGTEAFDVTVQLVLEVAGIPNR